MAVSLTRVQLQAALGARKALQPSEAGGEVNPAHVIGDDDADRLLLVVTASVEREAPEAPEAVQNEAAVRMAGWLSDDLRPIGAASVDVDYSSPELGAGRNAELNRNITYHRGQSGMRLSGARALLAPWRQRGAVA